MHIYNRLYKLPKDGEYVCAKFPSRPWGPDEGQYWVVVQFMRGISKAERRLLSERDLRKTIWKFEDEGMHNRVPYGWKSFGPGSFFGQEATAWFALPRTETLGGNQWKRT